MGDYVSEMRELIGTRPLLLCGAAVIVLDQQGRVLLHHWTDDDTWGLPGGALEPGEMLEQCATREVQEEVGVTCHSLELFGVYSGPQLYHRYPNGDEVHNVSAVHLCRNFSGTRQVGATEGKDAVFFTIEDIPEAITPPVRVVIQDLRRRHGQIVAGG